MIVLAELGEMIVMSGAVISGAIAAIGCVAIVGKWVVVDVGSKVVVGVMKLVSKEGAKAAAKSGTKSSVKFIAKQGLKKIFKKGLVASLVGMASYCALRVFLIAKNVFNYIAYLALLLVTIKAISILYGMLKSRRKSKKKKLTTRKLTTKP